MRIEPLAFEPDAIRAWTLPEGRDHNWPVVYAINDDREIYVGETVNATRRMLQHYYREGRGHLQTVRIVLDETYNKSVCLDLESHLIRYFAGDVLFRPLNLNGGITNAEYFDRARYRAEFRRIFDALRAEGLFSKSIEEIENSDLFKLSPFKALNEYQQATAYDIVEGLLADLAKGEPNSVVIEGAPGTGKTILAIYLAKLLRDIATTETTDPSAEESVFAEFFAGGQKDLVEGLRIGLVVPQQSLRESISNVFSHTPGLDEAMVLSPRQLADEEAPQFDLLIVDEAHRLMSLSAQASGDTYNAFVAANMRLAREGEDWRRLTQLDWVMRQSKYQIIMLDAKQAVRTRDLPTAELERLVASHKARDRAYNLESQMRLQAEGDYLGYVDQLLSDGAQAEPRVFGNYDLRFFDDVTEMRHAIFARDRELGLSRLVAGYGWSWPSKKDKAAFDIDLDGIKLRWNSRIVDWIASPKSLEEVGSIHTVQGYDLNYAGVIIGPELRWDAENGRLKLDKKSYRDRGAKQDNGVLGIKFSDAELLALVRNIYRVLLTRGMRGTYVYVCDPALRERLRPFFSQ